MTGNKHDIRYADKKGLATLLDFAVKIDRHEEEMDERSEEEGHEGGGVAEEKNGSIRAKIGKNGSSPKA